MANLKYQRPNGDKILAAPQATGGLKGVIAGKIKSCFHFKYNWSLFCLILDERWNYWSYWNIYYISNGVC